MRTLPPYRERSQISLTACQYRKPPVLYLPMLNLLTASKHLFLQLTLFRSRCLGSWQNHINEAIFLNLNPRRLPGIEPRAGHANKRFLPRLRGFVRAFHEDTMESTLVSTLKRYNDMFAPHPQSDSCIVCHAAEALRLNRPPDIRMGLLMNTRVLSGEHESIILAGHKTNASFADYMDIDKDSYPDPYEMETNFTRKVDIILELNGQWPALRLQEYKRAEIQSDSRDLTKPVADSELIMNFRLSAKDAYVLLPRLGHDGDAQPIGNFLDPDLVKGWIQQCKANHKLCPHTPKAQFPVDLILIDTESMCIVDIAPGNKPSYLALSYICGSVSQPVLTQDTRKQWSIEGKLSEIDVPRTILDAIDLAKMIGYSLRFFWVDALCIVQDYDSIRHNQIAQMCDTYQSAELTLVAAGSSDCSEAIPGISLGRQVPRDETFHNIPGLPLMKLPASMKYSIESSNWKTRGWTFQEELCSQRILVLLPYCAVFACASALFREYLCFEIRSSSQDSQDAQGYEDSQEGLTLLSVTLRNLQKASPQQQIAWFQSLVKQYIHRSLSRDDDIENAFTGVSRMLEPVFASLYHSVPEKYFADFIHGCWFWDTSSVRRAGAFPSWSCVGWIYRPGQRELGVKAMAGQNTVLHFYRQEVDIRRLGQSLQSVSRLKGLDDENTPLFKHFVPDEKEIRAQFNALTPSSNSPGHLIAFTTSSATLHLRLITRQIGFNSQTTREYHVVQPHTRRLLTSIRLRSDFVNRTGEAHRFIVIAYDMRSDAFQLMLVAHCSNAQTVERINVTVQTRLVRAGDWVSADPHKSTFIMAQGWENWMWRQVHFSCSEYSGGIQ